MGEAVVHPEAVQKRAVWLIALGTGVTNAAVTLWFPFLPLYMLYVGAADEADAIFWVAVGQAAQGLARLVSGPVWGVLADRHGRKQMFVRALYSAALTCFIVGVIGAPWQLCIALGLHGLLSGFVPAAVALTSVTVPDGRIKSALSLVTASQYLGTAIGPMLGAILVLAFGYRGAILGSGLAVVLVASLVWRHVPGDMQRRVASPGVQAVVAEPLEPFRLHFQLLLATFLYFILFAITAFRLVSTSIALQGLVGGDATHVTGIAFAFGGVASALGIWAMAGKALKRQRIGTVLAASSVLMAATHFLLAGSDSVEGFILWFTVISLLNAAMMPATNTLIALNVSRGRRGTAFGLASSAQAIAFMVGPMAAAGFARVSLQTGFSVVALVMIAMAVLIKLGLKEPESEAAP